MGTRGLFAVRYKGNYYIRYNHFDSYPDGLGQDLVNGIPVSEERFEEWLKSQRKLCENMASERSDRDYETSTSPPANDLFIEWTYTYDLDNLNFVVDSKAHFSLRAIAKKSSDEWIQFISSDARGQRCLGPETPPLLIGQFLDTGDPFLGGDPVPSVGEFVPTSIISPSTWSQPLTPDHQRLMLAQVNLSIAETYSTLSTFGQYSTSSVKAQDLAMSFLEAIVPNNQAIVANRQSPTFPIDKPALRGDPWFWYRGCLVLLATNLDDNERFQIYVQAVAARVKAKNLDKCTALLWSVGHVAVVEISGGSVSHSDPIPLLAAYGSDEEGFVNALHLLWHYLPYPRWRIVTERATTEAGIPDFGGFPTEVVMKIMALTDQLHYPKYQFLSHGFFKMWWKHLRVASYTILPNRGEIGETSRFFNAYSADESVAVKLQMKILWGTPTGNIWHRDDPGESEEPTAIWWSLHCREKEGGSGNDEDFSQNSINTKYRLQRFYSYWPEDLYNLPRVPDQFSSQSDILLCEAKSL